MIDEGLNHHVSRDNKIQRFFDNLTCRVICSGDEICLQTTDPERLPLPSRTLQMQYVLQCVSALKGAGERDESEYGDDDDDDVDGLRMLESDASSTLVMFLGAQ
jgi:hypothetical protein